MIVRDIIDDVIKKLQQDDDEFQRDIKQWIIDAEREMIRLHDFSIMCYKTIITGDGTDTYLLPSIFGKLYKDSPINLLSELADGRPTPIANINSNTHDAHNFELLNYIDHNAVASFTSPGANQRVIVYDPSVNMQETIILNGLTQVDTNDSFAKISYINKEGTTEEVTLIRTGTDILLPTGAGTYSLQSIKFGEEYNNSNEIEIKFVKKLRKLENDTDMDELIAEYGDIIKYYCYYRGYADQENDKRSIFYLNLFGAEVKKIIREDRIKKRINNFFDFIPREHYMNPGGHYIQ